MHTSICGRDRVWYDFGLQMDAVHKCKGVDDYQTLGQYYGLQGLPSIKGLIAKALNPWWKGVQMLPPSPVLG